MREAGILSNRVFDALACGAPVVSDEIADLPDGFGDFILAFDPQRPIDQAIAAALAEDSQRRTARRSFADTVRQQHSFDRRAESILECARALIASRQPAR
jgi:spore maturation protein CgeB